MFDFVAGSTNVGDGTIASTFYFDDIKYANVPLSVEENDRANAFVVRPNPSSNYWVLSNTMGSSFQVEVYDIKGQLIDQSKSNQGLEVAIDGTKYAAGVYYAKVTTAAGSEIVRLIKK